MTTTKYRIDRRAALGLIGGATLVAVPGARVSAQTLDKISHQTNWRAQAEHGGYYYAVVNGIYKKYGIECDLRMGGPQQNPSQLLLGGRVDTIMSNSFECINYAKESLPFLGIAAIFQKDPQVLVSHPGVGNDSLAALKGKPLLIGAGGRVQHAPNLPGWTDVPVGAELTGLLGIPVVQVTNEADLAALAALRFGPFGAAGPGRPGPTFLFVSGGIGVGAGIVLDGRLFRGVGGRAGELGHVVVEPDGRRCRCGGRGCLEQAAGQEALLRATGTATVDDLLARPAAAIDPTARALGVALAGAVHLLDVRTVILGGLYARLWERQSGGFLADAIEARTYEAAAE